VTFETTMTEPQQFSAELLRPAADVALVVAEGEIDIYTAPRLQVALDEGLEPGVQRLIVDLTEVPFIDSSAINVLVTTFRRLQELGAGLDVVGSRPSVLRVFKVTGLLDTFGFYASRQEALAARRELSPSE
jgi:anti-sigma B factor antagonist